MICIIDYGAGNLKSVSNALDYIGAENIISADRDRILAADKIILPGVGAFGDAMASLKKCGLVNTVYDAVESGKPFMGICLGMQMLFEDSQESPGVPGLGIFKGHILRFPSDMGLKVPQIGWNDLKCLQPDSVYGCADGKFVYSVHSYYLKADDPAVVAATANYGMEFHAAVAKGNVCASQFHPEKSGQAGLEILRNWAG
jgi:glutamine amidotransferase